jgi:MarR family transcriptional regulator, organic hydroperoxide resistance regulator
MVMNYDVTVAEQGASGRAEPGVLGSAVGHPLAEDVNWLIHRAALGFGEVRERALAELGLSVREQVLLSVLGKVRGMTQLELAGLVGLDKSIFTSTVDSLERKGLVRRNIDPRDRRVRRPELTPTGEALCRRGDQIASAAQDDLLGVLPEGAVGELLDVLRALVFGPFARSVSYAPGSAEVPRSSRDR